MFAHQAFRSPARRWTSLAAVLALTTAIGLLSSCGTRVAHNDHPAPSAVITPIGQVPTSSAGANPVTITVRSGADVLLSAKESDGHGLALVSFEWKQVGGPALPALPDAGALLYRNNNGASFRAPQLTASADPIQIQLTIKNERGVSSTAIVAVTVLPANDQDRFLFPPPPGSTAADNHFTVAVVTQDGFGTSAATSLPNDVPACVQVERSIVYVARDGQSHTTPSGSLTPMQSDLSWSKGSVVAGAQAGNAAIASAVQSYGNPRTTFNIPWFNDEELFALYNQPSNTQLSLQLVPSDVDSASLQLAIQAIPGSCDGKQPAALLANRPLTVAILDANGQVLLHSDPGGVLNISTDALRLAVGTQPVQTAASAHAYYQAIDPNAFTAQDSKSNLTDWLTANCFDPTQADYGVGKAGANGAHSVYTNNFDLGFGRDMYFMKCTAPQHDKFGNISAQPGDMAAVVVNYPSLEAAALKDQAAVAVAMEYSAAPGTTGPRFTKFYVFAPDDRTGEFKRVQSLNFDHRGQKFLPQACTSCHGGNTPSLPASFAGSASPPTCSAGSFDANNCYPPIHDPTTLSSQVCNPSTGANCLPPGDVDAAFLPWDPDSFLFSDAPLPANRDPAFLGTLIGKAPFTRSAQEPGIKALNQFAYSTWQPEMESVPDGSGGTVTADRFAAARSMVEHWYGGTGFPQASYTDFTDASPPPGWANQSGSAPIYHGAFARTCRMCHTLNADPTKQFSGLNTAALPLDGYTAFNNVFTKTTRLGQSYAFQQGIMPLARLTMDRLWVNFTSPNDRTTAAATLLANDIGLTGSAATVGTPLAVATTSIDDGGSNGTTVEPSLACGGASLNSPQRGSTVRLSSKQSDFAASTAWTLNYTSCNSQFTSSSSVLVGTQTSEAAFSPDKPGLYTVTMTVGNGSTTSQQTAAYLINNKIPTLTGPATSSASRTSISFVGSQQVTLSGTLGDGTCADQHVTIVQPVNGTGAVSAGSCIANGASFTVPLTYTPTTVGQDQFQVSVQDIDNDSSQLLTIYVNVTSSLSAVPDSINANAGTPAPAAPALCVLKDDSLNGQSPITIATGSAAHGGVQVLTDDAFGTHCGSTPYVGQQYIVYTAAGHYIGSDSFSYTITGPGNQTSNNNISVTVAGTVDFRSQVFPTLNGTCTGCHSSGPYQMFLPAFSGSPDNNAVLSFYQSLCGSGVTAGPCTAVHVNANAPAPGGTLVTAGDSATSRLYQELFSPSSGTMGTSCASPPSTSCTYYNFSQTVLKWLNEGAYCTTSGAACPPN